MVIRLLCLAGTLALLSRIVDPATMGLYGVAWAAAALGQNVSRNGAAQGLIALPKLETAHVAAAHVLAASLSITIGLLLALTSPAVEAFYGMEGLGHAFLIGAPVCSAHVHARRGPSGRAKTAKLQPTYHCTDHRDGPFLHHRTCPGHSRVTIW